MREFSATVLFAGGCRGATNCVVRVRGVGHLKVCDFFCIVSSLDAIVVSLEALADLGCSLVRGKLD